MDGPLAGSGDTTNFIYDAGTGDMLTITQPVIGSTQLADYDGAGSPGRIVNVNSQADTFTYDGRGRVTGISHLADGSSSSISYNNAGKIESKTDEDGVSYSYTYDASYGRLSRLTDINGNYIAYGYDSQGNLIEKSKHDPQDNRTSRERWDYQQSEYPGLLYKEIKVNDSFKTYDYDAGGNVETIADFEGHTTAYAYDALTRLETVTQPGTIVTTYGYDAQGNLTSVTDANSVTTTYAFDDMGRMLSTSSPDSGAAEYVYNAIGNPVEKTDARGITVTYAYDQLYRLTGLTFPDPLENITFTYDEGINGIGFRTGMYDPSGSTAFEYDERGRLVKQTATIDAENHILQRTFTNAGRLASIVYPSLKTAVYSRNNAGKVTEILYDSTTIANGFVYQPFGAPVNMNIGAATIANDVGECGCLENSNTGEPLEQGYQYDDNGNLTAITGPADYLWYNQNFTYDSLSRLTTAQGSYGNISYTYDNVGNRLTRAIDGDVENYTYVTGTNRLEAVTGARVANYTYDANGNITGIDSTALAYNQNNRLAQVEDTGTSTILGQYTYNALGQRIKKIIDGATVIFHYDFDGRVIGETHDIDVSDVNKVEYVYFNDNRLAKVDVRRGPIYYFANNQLGTPQMVMDDTNTVIWEAEYRPFGETEVVPKSTETVMDWVPAQSFRFPGQYSDNETGLHYNYHRYYDPTTGRYMRPDPVGLAGGINLFAYANHNPINKTDPLGLYNLWDFGEDTLSFAAGLGNAVTFGGTTWVAERLMDSDKTEILRQTKKRSLAFKAGEFTSLGLGASRLAYAGFAKGSSVYFTMRGATMKNATIASAFRNTFKKGFSANPWRKYRIYSFEEVLGKYKTAEEIIKAAGRTNMYYNLLGFYTTASSITAITIDRDCGGE